MELQVPENQRGSEYCATITGTGSAFPGREVSNHELVDLLADRGVNASDRWIRTRTGINARRFAEIGNEKERNSRLAELAALRALEMAGRDPMDVDCILYATCTPETLIPSTACWLQSHLQAENAWAMDLNAACTGFVYGLALADQIIGSGGARTVLLAGSEVMSAVTNWNDPGTAVIFGDGAGVVVIEHQENRNNGHIVSSHLHSEGDLGNLLHIPAGGSALEVTPDAYRERLNKMSMDGRGIFREATRTLSDYAERALASNGYTVNDIAWFIPHQANLRIIESVADRIGLPMERVVVNLDRFGNTSAGTIPSALDEAVRDGRIRKGDLVLMDAFGAGLTYGSVLLRW